MSFNLPPLPDGWKYNALDVCTIDGSISYGVVQPGQAQNEGVPLVRVNNFRDGKIDLIDLMNIKPEIEAKYARTRLKGGEVLLTLVGSVGQVAIASNKLSGFNVARAVAVIHPILEIGAEWISICLRSPLSQHLLNSRANTTVQTTVNLKDLKALPIPIPPKKERSKIVEMIFSLDNRIDLLRETNATIEAIAQALFKSWFIDFDPVRAKAEGREPEGIDGETAALFPDRFEETKLGSAPEGWEIKSIGDISEILNGCAFKSGDYVDEDGSCFVLRTKNFHDDGYAKRLSDDVFLPNTFTKSHQQYLCEPFDFHLVMVGASIGKTSVLLPHMLPALRNQNMWCFRPKVNFQSKFFIHEIVKYKVSEALKSSAGSAREFFRKGDFEKFKIVCPTNSLLSVYENIVNDLKNRIAVNESQSLLLSQLRDLLLPRLISGQLQLPCEIVNAEFVK